MMATEHHWRDPAGPLKKLAAALYFEADKLDLNEWPDELAYHNQDLPTDKLFPPRLKTQELDALDNVFKELPGKYRSALTFRLKFGEEELNPFHEDYERSKLDVFFEKIGGLPVELDLKICKKELASYWGFAHAQVIFKIFLFPGALERALSGQLTDLEHAEKPLMKGFTGEEKIIILVPGHKNIALNGVYLAVLGGDEAVAKWEDYLPTGKPGEARDKVSFVHDDATIKPRWTGIELDHLTPLQLSIGWTNPQDDTGNAPASDDVIARPLYAQLLACSLLYMSTYSRLKAANPSPAAEQASDSWVATFAADKYLARIEVGDTIKIGETLIAVGGDNPWALAKTIGDLANWAYKEVPGVANRLNVLQAVIASALQDSKPSANLQEIVRRARDLSDRVQQRWDLFIEEKLDKYFLQIKELRDTVETTTKSYNEQVQALTKALTDNMLAAVAVVVGSFIAAIFKSPFEVYIFWVGTGIYVGYLVFFPICIGLFSAWQRFNDSRAGFAKSERDFGNLLSQAEVQQIVGPTVSDSERRFRRWFRFTTVLYAIVVLSLISAMWKLPGEIRKWSDNFEVTDVAYSQPATSEVVPLLIHGRNFDKDKEIVVTIGDSGFTNTDGQTLKVHGSTVLTLSPQQKDLTNANQKHHGFVFVKQGSAVPKKLPLPSGPSPIPLPTFEQWNVATLPSGGVVQASGSNFGSISDIRFNGAKLNFKVSDDGRRLELSDVELLKAPLMGKSLETTLKNGERMQQMILVKGK